MIAIWNITYKQNKQCTTPLFLSLSLSTLYLSIKFQISYWKSWSVVFSVFHLKDTLIFPFLHLKDTQEIK